MPNPFVWFLNLQASWGLLPTEWWNPNLQILVGGFCGMVVVIAAFIAFVEGAFDFGYRFDDNIVTLVGYRIFATTFGLVATACSAYVCFCAGLLVTGLLLAKPILTVVALLILGPLLMLVGRINWRMPNLNLRRKQKVSSATTNESASMAFELGDDFHTIDYEGEKIIMPN